MSNRIDRAKAFEISAMEGRKIAHRYFSEDEWIQIMPNGKIRTEEGYSFPIDEFMSYRQDDVWENDWVIINETL